MLRQWLPMQEVLVREGRSAEALHPPPLSVTTVPETEPPLPGAAHSCLDEAVLGELFEIMESEAAALLQGYLDSAPALLGRIDQALGRDDSEEVARAAHSLKSSSANVGAMAVSALAKRLEFIGRGGRLGEAGPCWQEMRAAYDMAEKGLRRVIADAAP
jgi:HPt (histidine-containing phosphotransfer) domain-containing protein